MVEYIYWFMLALVLIGVEMATGTFYLLVLSLAMAVGGAAALLGLGMPVQFVLAAAAAVTGILILRRQKVGRGKDAASQNFDTGQPVRVLSWHEDGTARVYYRGAEWDAELAQADTAREGTFYIQEIRGSVLILSGQKPAAAEAA